MEDGGYLFDNASGETPTRFAGLEGLWDESTIRYLSNVGVGAGWRCWEIGAGGGSIARWLAERVAPTGTVLATDLDLTRIPKGSLSNLVFVRHDVVHDRDPDGRVRPRARTPRTRAPSPRERRYYAPLPSRYDRVDPS